MQKDSILFPDHTSHTWLCHQRRVQVTNSRVNKIHFFIMNLLKLSWILVILLVIPEISNNMINLIQNTFTQLEQKPGEKREVIKIKILQLQ